MTAGRPSKAREEAYPELSELAAWLSQALAAAGYKTVNQFLKSHPFDKNVVYGVMNRRRFINLDSFRRLSSALGCDLTEAEPIWFRARLQMERGPKRQAALAAPLTSWADLPWPEPAIRHLLLAQAGAAELLPYKLLGLEPPPLSAIYVRQYLRAEESNANRPGTDPDILQSSEVRESLLLATDAINRNNHLLITAEAGAGKTILTQEITRRLARIWVRDDSASESPVDQPVIPLRIPARALVDTGAFSTVLANAVTNIYGLSMVTEPRPERFSQLVHGARWLLFIDGIDEIVDEYLRVKVIQAIAGHARADAPYRIVVTTRPILRGELAPLLRAGFAHFSIELFGWAQLEVFANRWFKAQDPAHCDERAQAFLREIRDGRLRDAALNPLLAAVAAVTKTREPNQPLPSSRVELYGKFCDYLIGDQEDKLFALSQIRRHASDAYYQSAEWLYLNRYSLIKYLADRQLAGESGMFELARAWINDRRPNAQDRVNLKEQDIRQCLIGTGLLVAEGTGLRFLHQVVAEYLAAVANAEGLPSDFIDLGPWTNYALQPERSTFAVFTLVLCSRRGHDLGSILRRLLQGPPRHLLFAGRIVGDCGLERPIETIDVINRLMDLALGMNAVRRREKFTDDLLSEPSPSGTDAAVPGPAEVLWTLGRICGDQSVIERLQDIAARTELAADIRIHAAVALGRAASTDNAVTLIQEISKSTKNPSDRLMAAELVLFLKPEAVHVADTILEGLEGLVDKPEARIRAAELLVRVGQHGRAVDLAWLVLREADCLPRSAIAAVRIVLDNMGDTAVAGLLEIADRLTAMARPTLRWILIELVAYGARDLVIKFCRNAFIGSRIIPWQFSCVAGGWVMAAGPSALKEVYKFLERREGTEAASTEAAGEVALRLFEAGHQAEAFNVSMEILRSPQGPHYNDWEAAWIGISTAQDEDLPSILEMIDQLQPSTGWGYQKVIDKLVQLGESARAVGLSIASVDASSYKSISGSDVSIRALQSADGKSAVIEDLVRRVSEERLANNRVSLIETLMEVGALTEASSLARRMITESQFHGRRELGRVIRVLVLCEGTQFAPEILSLIKEYPDRYAKQHIRDLSAVADALSRIGGLTVSKDIWLWFIVDETVPFSASFEACASLVQSGNREQAIRALRNALEGEGRLSSEGRSRLGALLAWAVLRNPNAGLEDIQF
jgi:hypothetical protein